VRSISSTLNISLYVGNTTSVRIRKFYGVAYTWSVELSGLSELAVTSEGPYD
jgi:hypothetical protein